MKYEGQWLLEKKIKGFALCPPGGGGGTAIYGLYRYVLL